VLALILCASLSQAPKVAVVPSPSLNVPARRVADLTHSLMEMIDSNGMQAAESQGTCENRACLISNAKNLNAVAVISVAFAAVGKDTVVDLEALTTTDGKSIAQTTFTVRGDGHVLTIEASSFVNDVRRALPTQKETSQEPPKKDPNLEPEHSREPPEVVTPNKGSLVPGFVAAGITLAAGTVAGVFGVLGLTENSRLHEHHDGEVVSQATYDSLVQLRDSSNSHFTIGAIVLGAAVALAVTTIILFVTN
jgi:hypothetical protein